MAKKNNKVLKTRSKRLSAASAKKNLKRIHSKKVNASHQKKAVNKQVLRPKVSKASPKTQKKVKEVVPQVVENKDISFAIDNAVFSEYIGKNVGSHALDIIKILNETQQTDDKLAATLAIKVNEVRRMLNVLNSFSITRYDINKDSKGWLTFKWYLDREKLRIFTDTVVQNSVETGAHLQDNCNDFFFCKACYAEQKVIFPFDTAFEASFKCGECGKPLSGLNREETQTLVYQAGA
jgi:transcription factor E